MNCTVLTRTSALQLGSIDDLGELVNELGVNRRLAGHIVHFWVCLLQDSPLLERCGPKPRQVFRRFVSELTTFGLRDRIGFYSDLATRLMKSLSKDGSTPEFLAEFLNTPVFKEYLEFHRTSDPNLLRYLVSFCKCCSKAELSYPDQAETAFRGWEETEERLSQLAIPKNDVEWLKLIVTSLLPDFDPSSPFMGKHGSGAVAGDERGTLEKLLHFTIDPKLKRAYSACYYTHDRPGHIKLLLDLINPTYTTRALYSKLMFVPKNSKTFRSICMEPTAYMLIQQDIMIHLIEQVNRSLFGRFINIDDQSRNQAGAIYGTEHGEVDTLDQSAASDSVHVDLVRGIFPRRWRHLLLSTRTSEVLCPNGEIRKVNKFAPMGSALCFPVQSIIFTSIVIYAYMLHFLHHDYSDVRSPSELGVDPSFVKDFVRKHISKDFGYMSAQYESIATYGDDIICDSNTTHIVLELLKRFGFLPNKSKSFIGEDAVRESCGIYSYKGVDITPVIYKARSIGSNLDIKALFRLIAVGNMAGDVNYRHLQRYIINFTLKWNIPKGMTSRPIAFSSDRNVSFAFYSHNPHNSHLAKRAWSIEVEEGNARAFSNKDVKSIIDPYQRGTVKRWVLTQRTRRVPREHRQLYDAYGYHMYVRKQEFGDEDVIVTPRKLNRDTTIKWAWTPI